MSEGLPREVTRLVSVLSLLIPILEMLVLRVDKGLNADRVLLSCYRQCCSPPGHALIPGFEHFGCYIPLKTLVFSIPDSFQVISSL